MSKKILSFYDDNEFQKQNELVEEICRQNGSQLISGNKFPSKGELIAMVNNLKPQVLQLSSFSPKLNFDSEELEPVEISGVFKQFAKSPECIILNITSSEQVGRQLSNYYNYVIINNGPVSEKASKQFFQQFYSHLLEKRASYAEAFKAASAVFESAKTPSSSPSSTQNNVAQTGSSEGTYCIYQKRKKNSDRIRLKVLASSEQRMKYVLGKSTTPKLSREEEKQKIQQLKTSHSGGHTESSGVISGTNSPSTQNRFSTRQFSTLILILIVLYIDVADDGFSSFSGRFLNLIITWILFETAIFGFLHIQQKLVDIWDYVIEAKLILSDFVTLLLGFSAIEGFRILSRIAIE